MFISQSQPRIQTLRMQIQTIKKESMYMADYFAKIKRISNTLLKGVAKGGLYKVQSSFSHFFLQTSQLISTQPIQINLSFFLLLVPCHMSIYLML